MSAKVHKPAERINGLFVKSWRRKGCEGKMPVGEEGFCF